ncbi:MAG: SLBB domain-containing protein, partial [Gammaproteobacteria bacterium]|nr:SLBB domain-containing protein [Gammaproteobacteria bacterium]
LVKRLDLYALLLNGDTRNDVQLRAGDVVFIPPASSLVGIDGEIRRPALYELPDGATVEELINLAGGLLPTADAKSVRMRRVLQAGTRDVETLDVLGQADLNMPLRSGDILTIYPVLEDREDAVFLSGHVTRPGSYEWQPGMTITDLLGSEKYLRPKADLGYLLIRREVGPDRRIEILSANLRAARLDPTAKANILLQHRDHITVFELGVVRSAAVKAALLELEAQSTRDEPFQMVKISGQVPAPGSYPLEEDMHISDLLRAGGGLSAAAFAAEAELTRYVVNEMDTRSTELIDIDLAAIRAGNDEADLKLVPYDYLNIKEIPAWDDQFEVEILGEVRFPGIYPVRPGETLSSVLARAGGMTPLAFPDGSIFTRESLQEREVRQLQTLESRLEADLVGLALRASADPTGNAQSAMSVGQSLLEQLRKTQPTGRLVINLDAVLEAPGNAENDIVLRDGDKLHVPHRSQEVMVLGEVQYATSHLFMGSKARDSYIQLSGGLT